VLLYFKFGDSDYEVVPCCDGSCFYGDATTRDAGSTLVAVEDAVAGELGVSIAQLYQTHAAVPKFCNHDDFPDCGCLEWEVLPIREAREAMAAASLCNPPPRLRTKDTP